MTALMMIINDDHHTVKTLLSETLLPNRGRGLEKTFSRGKPIVGGKEDLIWKQGQTKDTGIEFKSVYRSKTSKTCHEKDTPLPVNSNTNPQIQIPPSQAGSSYMHK